MENHEEDLKYYNNKVVQLNTSGRAVRIGYTLNLPQHEGEDTYDTVRRYRDAAEREGEVVEKIRLIPKVDTIVFLEEAYRDKAVSLAGEEFLVLQKEIKTIMDGDYRIPGEDYFHYSPHGKG